LCALLTGRLPCAPVPRPYYPGMAEQPFPKPWQVFEHTESFGVADANGDSIAFVYFAEANRAACFTVRK